MEIVEEPVTGRSDIELTLRRAGEPLVRIVQNAAGPVESGE
ncbi:MAG: hypothetical protein ABJD11_06980 [Gemmatimonadota bacterium]